MRHAPSQRRGRSGFSLVEVALALLVVSVGLTSILGLFLTATTANKRAIQDTQIGLFADYVLNGLRWRAEQVPWADITDDGTFSIPSLGGQYAWVAPDAIVVDREQIRVVAYNPVKEPSIEEMAFHYQTRITDLGATRKGVTLSVWPGAYGLTETNEFYTELYRTGG